jgi:hypothetical protein
LDNALVLVLIVALLVAVGIAIWMFQQKRRTEGLREQFGPEYERAVHSHDSRSEAERELAARKERIEQLHIRPLSPNERSHFVERWQSAQAQFVDDPKGAIHAADEVVGEVMQLRGYPMGNFEQRAADISVDHPHVIENYRAAHSIAQRSARGEADTEALRKAMVHYRALFADLLETRDPTHTEVRR